MRHHTVFVLRSAINLIYEVLLEELTKDAKANIEPPGWPPFESIDKVSLEQGKPTEE